MDYKCVVEVILTRLCTHIMSRIHTKLQTVYVHNVQTCYWHLRYFSMFTDIVQYHTHRGTLHVKSFNQDGHISTMYSGHYISLSHDQSK